MDKGNIGKVIRQEAHLLGTKEVHGKIPIKTHLSKSGLIGIQYFEDCFSHTVQH